MRHLDTNVVIAYLTGNQTVASQLKDHLPEVAISSLVLAELRFGARASARVGENIERLDQFLQINETGRLVFGLLRALSLLGDEK